MASNKLSDQDAIEEIWADTVIRQGCLRRYSAKIPRDQFAPETYTREAVLEAARKCMTMFYQYFNRDPYTEFAIGMAEFFWRPEDSREDYVSYLVGMFKAVNDLHTLTHVSGLAAFQEVEGPIHDLMDACWFCLFEDRIQWT